MAYTIDQEKCIQCGVCECECPEGAIVEIDGLYTIDAALCNECGSCADACPSEAPYKV
ncbi:MAG: 4Fe-4S binding protein [Anaerolineaceae bacterium]|nr:4Fe-4S binding protein [Anaerolineaceae bacterium]